MEKLKYVIEDSTIAELLGVQNFTNKESAILEVVKNAFDANANIVEITFNENQIVICDDGDGMDEDNIRDYWMHIGRSNKGYQTIDRYNNCRVLSGSKGIGRFALSRLGEHVEVESKKENSKYSVKWTTNWNESTISTINDSVIKGTKITIDELRDRWNERDVDELKYFLSRTYNDSVMDIFINYNNSKIKVGKYFSEPTLGINCLHIINLNFDSENTILDCTIESDEFSNEANKYCEGFDINKFQKKVNVFDLLLNDKEINLDDEELRLILKSLGDFDSEFYFFLNVSSTDIDMESFLYKHKMLKERYDSGVVLYRNSFSLSSYDGEKDWLRLGKRSRKSPAAATHPTGNWRVKENQLAGKVIIDKEVNKVLEDLSNRQGLNENEYYKVFMRIIDRGIEIFEDFRQSIIREINKKNETEKKSEVMFVKKIIKQPNYIKNITFDEQEIFAKELNEMVKSNENLKYSINEQERRYKYDIRILNVLATNGLKSASLAHEMRNDRNELVDITPKIVKALKKFDLWEVVNKPQNTNMSYYNIPNLLKRNGEVNSKVVTLIDSMLNEIRKSSFNYEDKDIIYLLSEIKNYWERDFSWVQIEILCKSEINFKLSDDILKVVLDNLILNSIQQNEHRDILRIKIKLNLCEQMLKFSYCDDGVGLCNKYLDNPHVILKALETTRKDGHGIGMWIVNNTVIMSGGSIENISGENGFSIEFSIGGKNGRRNRKRD